MFLLYKKFKKGVSFINDLSYKMSHNFCKLWPRSLKFLVLSMDMSGFLPIPILPSFMKVCFLKPHNLKKCRQCQGKDRGPPRRSNFLTNLQLLHFRPTRRIQRIWTINTVHTNPLPFLCRRCPTQYWAGEKRLFERAGSGRIAGGKRVVVYIIIFVKLNWNFG